MGIFRGISGHLLPDHARVLSAHEIARLSADPISWSHCRGPIVHRDVLYRGWVPTLCLSYGIVPPRLFRISNKAL